MALTARVAKCGPLAKHDPSLRPRCGYFSVYPYDDPVAATCLRRHAQSPAPSTSYSAAHKMDFPGKSVRGIVKSETSGCAAVQDPCDPENRARRASDAYAGRARPGAPGTRWGASPAFVDT